MSPSNSGTGTASAPPGLISATPFTRSAAAICRLLLLLLLAGTINLASIVPLPLQPDSGTAQAGREDRSKPISIKADRSEFDQQRGIQTLQGNVEISQGSLLIKAETIKIELRDGTLYKITGTGSPVRFQQLSDRNQLMRGQSNSISYDTAKSEILFSGNAGFERPGQSLKGHEIRYNLQNLTFAATGNDRGRVNIVLQPSQSQ